MCQIRPPRTAKWRGHQIPSSPSGRACIRYKFSASFTWPIPHAATMHEWDIMKLPCRQFLHLAAGAAALPAVSRIARAQAYPSRPIRLVIPFPPGGAYDAVGRPWADKMKPLLGTVVVENIAGAGGSLVFRFRSSHHFAAPSSANFGIKGTLAISILSSAAYGFEVPTRDCRELVGTSNPPHSWRAAVPATERCGCRCKRASAIGRADRASCEALMSVDADTVRRIAH